MRQSPLFARLNAEQAHTYSLVLAAEHIPHFVYAMGMHHAIHVADAWRGPAQQAIALYLSENPTAENPPAQPPHMRSYSAVYAVATILIIHLATGSGPHRRAFFAAFGADAEKIMAGEFFRCITALLLHGDSAHLLANMASAALFGTFAANAYGWGIAWFLMVLSGAQGNFLTAWWYGHNHLAVGASTAVFAAVGLCAASSFRQWHHDRSGRLRPWIPLAGGLALVGWLGTGPQSDILAHLLGFGAGLANGALYARVVGRICPWAYQVVAILIMAAAIAGSWLWGVYQSG
jgi:membrane associated rhomboid family serine protease